MVHTGFLLAFLLFPVVSGFDALWAHQKAHESGSVRLLKTRETVHESGSDLVFNWVRCVICEGYDVRVHLHDVFGKRELRYRLVSAVTALKVTDISPRTTYKLVVKKLPLDTTSSEVSGRSYSPEAPLPVEKLLALAVTSSSIQIEWESKNADGFIARILENRTVIQEKVLPDFNNHSIVIITGLKAETNYQIQVNAFYFPPGGKSISTVASTQVKTLPMILPNIDLKWKLDNKLELYWSNPDFPVPVAHDLSCEEGSESLLGLKFSGSTDSVAIPSVAQSADIHCILRTRFSQDEGSVVTSKAVIDMPAENSPPSPSTSDSYKCATSDRYRGYNRIQMTTSGTFERQRVDGMDLLVLKFSLEPTESRVSRTFEYKMCEEGGSCAADWITVEDYSKILVPPGKIKSWVPHIVYFRFHLRCSGTDSRYGVAMDFHSTVGSMRVPGLIGTVDPVLGISSAQSQVFWEYNNSSAKPDYFLITHCTGDSCTSQSAPGQNRSINLGKLRDRHVYFVTIQAVKLWADEIYASPTRMTSMVAPKSETQQGVTLTADEIANSTTVQLVIAHNVTTDERSAVNYHVAVCSKPVSVWTQPELVKSMSRNYSCESIVSTNSTLDLIREPWTFYEVSVLLCYGAFDYGDPVNVTLPIFKQLPGPLAALSWDPESSILTWEYETSIPSGFAISIRSLDNERKYTDTLVGPLDRQCHVDTSNLTDSGFIVSLMPFVAFEGLHYNGPRSELAINMSASTPAALPENDDESEILG